MTDVTYFATPGPMTRLPDWLAGDDLPDTNDGLRTAVQGLLVHRDWAPAYGLTLETTRLAEQHLRTTIDVLDRARELSDAKVGDTRPPAERVVGICRHYALLHVAFLRAQGTPARVRCGFANYFDRAKWYDHFITERHDGQRWVRDDPQVDDFQAQFVKLEFDPTDEPPGQFLDGAQAWRATRAGDLDPGLFGIANMWGASYIGGNVLLDLACLNKVELLPWDGWGPERDPFTPPSDDLVALYDELAEVIVGDDTEAIRSRYERDDVRVPEHITSWQDGASVPVTLELT